MFFYWQGEGEIVLHLPEGREREITAKIKWKLTPIDSARLNTNKQFSCTQLTQDQSNETQWLWTLRSHERQVDPKSQGTNLTSGGVMGSVDVHKNDTADVNLRKIRNRD